MKGFLVVVLAVISAATALPSVERDAQTRVVNGENANQGEFPHQVSVEGCIFGLFCSHICGGTIISPTAVLTAGHCIISTYTYRVILGITRLSETSASRQSVPVSRSIVHPLYPGGNQVAPNDLGIFLLSQPIVYSEQAQPARLPVAGAIPTGSAVLSGWGSTGSVSTPDHLQKVNVEIISIGACYTALANLLPAGTNIPLEMNGGNVCTSGARGVSACSGDSGGPLIQNGVLVGVVSWGITPCGTEGAPSVFVSPSAYIDFITANVQDLYARNDKPIYTLRTY